MKQPSKNKILQELRSLSWRESGNNDFKQFVNQMYAKENDRGAAILISTNVENALEYALEGKFEPERCREAFSNEGGVSQFHAKITLSYLLGLVDDETYLNLKIIRDLRNVFAHTKLPVDFNTPEIAAACSILKMPPLKPPIGLAAIALKPETTREFYTGICNAIIHNLFVMLMVRKNT